MECNVQFRSDGCLFGTVFETDDSFFTADFGVMTGVTPELYDGGYELWPALTDETLQRPPRRVSLRERSSIRRMDSGRWVRQRTSRRSLRRS